MILKIDYKGITSCVIVAATLTSLFRIKFAFKFKFSNP